MKCKCGTEMEDVGSEVKSLDAMGKPLETPDFIGWWKCPGCGDRCVVVESETSGDKITWCPVMEV